MNQWNNLNELASYRDLLKEERVSLPDVMSGSNGTERVARYQIPMAAGLIYSYAAKQVDDRVLGILSRLADEAQLASKFKIYGTPTIVFLDSNQNEIHRIEGYVDVNEFLDALKGM